MRGIGIRHRHRCEMSQELRYVTGEDFGPDLRITLRAG
jgi:hypothetical protein